jgi:uncharacterized protein
MVIQDMTKSECLSAIARARLGRLACARENQPYVVPIYFAYEEPYLYGFTTLGLKIEWMRSNPLVCVELDEMDGHDQWTSVIVFGRYEELPETFETKQADPHDHGAGRQAARPASMEVAERERQHAHELLQRHPEWWEPGCTSRKQRTPAGAATPIFYRIRIDRITGRRATPSPGDLHRSKPRILARESRSWLRNLFHALARPFARRRAMRGLE